MCATSKTWDRRPGGIEPLGLSAPTGLKPAPNTSQAQFGIRTNDLLIGRQKALSHAAGILKNWRAPK